MNGIAAPIVALESAELPEFLSAPSGVSVIMVVYMTGEALEESVACALRDPLVDELVIVDNGSTSAEAAGLRALADRDPRVVLVAGQGNIGFARGANLGARTARGDILVFLNPDAFLQPGCIGELSREIVGRPVPCIVGGRVLNADLTEQRGARRGEPWNFVHNVGNGDFQAIGVMLLANLKDHAGLRPVDRVLDIGCGNGRVAAQLAPMLSGAGRYIGFDISKAGIAACRRQFAGQPHMAFQHLDVWNGEYNAKGKVAEIDTVFPVADASIDLAFATSVFTHMRMPAVRRYLAEAARVLKPGGRFAFTAFALEPGREATEAFPFKRFDETSAAVDPKYPERAIGHRREVLEAAVAEAGLEVREGLRGYWAPGGEYDGGQDLFVVVKA